VAEGGGAIDPAGRAVPRHDARKAANDKLHPHRAFAQDEHALRTTSTFWPGEAVIRAIGPLAAASGIARAGPKPAAQC
jgi:hypothetical protein